MDPDLVREQEDAERAAVGLPPRKLANGSTRQIQSRHAPAIEGPVTFGLDSVPKEKTAPAATTQDFNPNRRALSPMGTGRRPDEDAAPQRQISGLLRLFLYAAGGGAIGAMAGFAGVKYFDLYKEQTEFFISCMAGGFALLFGLTHLLHYDHS